MMSGHSARWHLGSGRALKKWGKILDYVLCFPLHFFRALRLPARFTTEQSTVEASLFVKFFLVYLFFVVPMSSVCLADVQDFWILLWIPGH